jgi:phage-related protein
MGDKHPSAKPLKGFKGAGVLEIGENYSGDTYRAVYTVRFANAIYVLHTFKKKSTRAHQDAQARDRSCQRTTEVGKGGLWAMAQGGRQ